MAKRAAYIFILALASVRAMQSLQIRRYHSDRRSSTCWTSRWYSSGKHGAWWTSIWWLHTYLFGIHHKAQCLMMAVSMLNSGLDSRSRTGWVLTQLFQGAWRWIWCNDGSQTWYVARYIQGAHKEQGRIYRRDSQIQLIALIYVLFIIVSVEIILVNSMAVSEWHYRVRRGQHARISAVYKYLIMFLQHIQCSVKGALYNMGLSGPKSGRSENNAVTSSTTYAAEVRVWLYASSQEPGMSIQSLHDHMSGKLRVVLSHRFQE